jgi:hypothetical protein
MAFLRNRSSQAIVRTFAVLGVLTLVPLLVWDFSPRLFPERAHDALGAVPLILIAVACPTYALARRAPLPDLAKAFMLAAAFVFWAANQLWPDHPKAMLFNDVAIALFVVDVALAILGWPSSSAKIRAEAPDPVAGR